MTTEFSTPRDPTEDPPPADASAPTRSAFDELREHPRAVRQETPGRLNRLTEAPTLAIRVR
ncbi:hypothetical protein ACKI1I_40800 [Streptomyces turgidiscabies]|uniref:Uncharacterized protein n=1 Tax=Streptomyces turgidiscabies (strain Car8) TaxID=698760 RepID=L7FIY1_STRT8|nr:MULTISPECIES: hypothetical protein [Streptomyces]ELP70645.1 hypothetical protein STRTUCAR8_03739 [Streptomyces turgidiscabies Car8]MDX3497152.1 hypothetical protein [Streptomyces turgidiscabies]